MFARRSRFSLTDLLVKVQTVESDQSVGQVVRYLEAIAPGKTLVSLLTIDDPVVLAMAHEKKVSGFSGGPSLLRRIKAATVDLGKPPHSQPVKRQPIALLDE